MIFYRFSIIMAYFSIPPADSSYESFGKFWYNSTDMQALIIWLFPF